MSVKYWPNHKYDVSAKLEQVYIHNYGRLSCFKFIHVPETVLSFQFQ